MTTIDTWSTKPADVSPIVDTFPLQMMFLD